MLNEVLLFYQATSKQEASVLGSFVYIVEREKIDKHKTEHIFVSKTFIVTKLIIILFNKHLF